MNQQLSDIFLFIKIVIAISIISILFFEFTPSENDMPKHSNIITINLLNNFNKKSKLDILNIRKEFVKKSIFAKENYIPSEEIFGEIQDYKPWLSMFNCSHGKIIPETTGSSKESRFINNPSILIGIDEVNTMDSKCSSIKYSNYRNIPAFAIYLKPTKTLHVIYDEINLERNNLPFILNGINARDLGFNYAYVEKAKSSKYFSFINKTKNISTEPIELKDSIILSNDYNITGGCNTNTISNTEVQFKKEVNYKKSKIYIKLWKEKPKSAKDEADLTEIIHLNNSYGNFKKIEERSQKEYGYRYKEPPKELIKEKTQIELGEEIEVNQPVPLSYKTKQEVYEIRKSAIANSIFSSSDYQPSEEVFGGIQDGKPWISAKDCTIKNTGKRGIDGPSEEARYINNPALLVAIEYPYASLSCEDPNNKGLAHALPQKINYNKNKKEITVKYGGVPYCTTDWNFYHFKAINARDLGYKYGYIDLQKTKTKIEFSAKENITNSVVKFQDYIHLGYSCKQEGGCNNGSPYQPKLTFKYPCSKKGNNANQIIYIKLWKELPASVDDAPDMVEKILLY